MNKRLLISGLLLLLAIAACGAPPLPGVEPVSSLVTRTLPDPAETAPPDVTGEAPEIPWTPPTHPIQIRVVAGAGEFYDTRTGETFVPRGVNYAFAAPGGTGNNRVFSVGVYDHDIFSADMQRLSELGYNTVRMFTDTCNTGPDCIGRQSGTGLNPDYMDNIADAMSVAAEHGIFLLLTSNDIPDQGGYWAISDRCYDENMFPGYRNSHILSPCGHDASEAYWRDFMQALVEREAHFDAVLGWQLLNEQWLFLDQPPLSLTSGIVPSAAGDFDIADADQRRALVVENVRLYSARMKDVILEYDPTALVTMGFFAPKFPIFTETGGDTWYVDTAPLVEDSALDFFDFHGYPGGDIDVAGLATNYGMPDHAFKPVILGEYGAFTFIYNSIDSAARALTQWAADACANGFDGYLYWTYYPGGAVVGDGTWGFTDEDGYLMELFAPVNQPDPCVPVDVPNPNLAVGATVTASRALAEEPPANAIDENGNTQWGSGGDAPQWIDLDLGAAYPIRAITLTVGQWPEGETQHQVLVRGPGEEFRVVQEFSQFTQEGDILTATFDPPLENVQVVRIYTVSSPSWVAWKEVQIMGADSE